MITIVSHDAGGAEILSSFVKANPATYQFVLSGPAVSIFTRKLVNFELSNLEDSITNAEKVICSTSWQSDLEYHAIRLAKNEKVKSIAYIDHWKSYRNRFFRNDRLILPDEIWVCDRYAETIAQEEFPNIPIRDMGNYFLDEIQRNYQLVEANKGNSNILNKDLILYVSENISEHVNSENGETYDPGYTEFDSIDYFFKNLERISGNVANIVLRPHPSDRKGKYDYLLSKYQNFSISDVSDLIQDIARSTIVVGCDSMAMVVSLTLGKKVYSCIPPGGKKRTLPHTEIFDL